MRDLSWTVWDIPLIKASSPEAGSMQKQTQTYVEKVRQEGRGQHEDHIRVVISGLDEVSSAEGQHGRNPLCRTKSATRFDSAGWTTYKADIKRTTLNIVSLEKRLLVLEALGHTEAERKY